MWFPLQYRQTFAPPLTEFLLIHMFLRTPSVKYPQVQGLANNI